MSASDVLKAELDLIETNVGHPVTAREGVAELRRAPHLYPRFHDAITWDVQVAAQLTWEAQFRGVVKRLRVQYTVDDDIATDMRAVHWVRREGDPVAKEARYIEDIREDPRARMLLLQEAEREWRSLYAKYRHLEEFLTFVRETVFDVEPV